MTLSREDLLKKHPEYLSKLGRTCQCCGKKNLGRTRKGRRIRYNFHHTTGSAYKDKIKLGRNYVLLCVPCHRLVHALGGQWMSQGAVRRQNKKRAFGSFPNAAQRLFNLVCVLPFSVGTLVLTSVFFTLIAALVVL